MHKQVVFLILIAFIPKSGDCNTILNYDTGLKIRKNKIDVGNW